MTNPKSGTLPIVRTLLATLALALTACGAAPETAELRQGVESCGAGWTRYDVDPGACLAAFSYGYDWQEFTTRACGQACPEAFVTHGIHVDELGIAPLCNDVAQFGLLAHAGTDTLSVSIKADSGTVEEYPAGSPECDSMPPLFTSY